MTVDEVVRWIRAQNAHLGQLEILVEDAKCLEAREICGESLRAQVKYLLSKMHSSELKKLVRWEQRVLLEHGMKMQSKVSPERNLAWKRRKKRR